MKSQAFVQTLQWNKPQKTTKHPTMGTAQHSGNHQHKNAGVFGMKNHSNSGNSIAFLGIYIYIYP
jgi:hypothetical protein